MKKTIDKRVVITGLGPVTPIGIGKKEFWNGVAYGKPNFTTINKFDPSGFPTKIAGQIDDFRPEDYLLEKTLERLGRFGIENGGNSIKYAVTGASLALEDSGLELENEDLKRIGTMVGANIGDPALISGMADPNYFIDDVAFLITQYGGVGGANANIAYQFGLRGPPDITAGACATGTMNLKSAYRAILWGDADVMIAGSVSAPIVEQVYKVYSVRRSPMAADNLPMRPFDANRKGFTLSEGAGVLVIEEFEHALERGARIYCEIIGCGTSCDTGAHFSDITEEGYIEAIQNAFDSLDPEYWDLKKRIGHFNAHGSGTQKNDLAELNALRSLYGDDVGNLFISANKSKTGHAQEASSGMELIASTLALYKNVIPPTMGIEQLDENFNDLNIVRDYPTIEPIQYVLKPAAGFNGSYSSVILSKYEG